MAMQSLRTSTSLPVLKGHRFPAKRRSSSSMVPATAAGASPETKEKYEVARAEIHGELPPDLHLTLWDVFSRTASAHPDREAVVSLWQPAQPDDRSPELGPTEPSRCLRWTYHELLSRVESLARSLKSLGCGPGMQLAAVLWNSAEWGLFFWAAARVGMTFVPVDPRVADDVRSMLSSLDVQAVVVEDADDAAMVDGLGVKSPIQIQCSGIALGGWIRLGDLAEAEAFNIEAGSSRAGADTGGLQGAEVDDRNVALIVFTSGTTGFPKGCPHTQRNVISGMCDYDPNADKSIVDRWLVHTPVSHIFAVNNAMRAWKCGDAVVFASKKFDVGSTLHALTEEKCTIVSATPTLLKGLLAHHAFKDRQDLNLEVVTLAGTYIASEDIALARQGLGARAATQVYGMSEGAPLVSWSRTDHQLLDGYHDGVGKVLPGAAVRICHRESGRVLSRGEIGEMHVGGHSVISGYLGGVEAESFYNEASTRWLKTGDQARMDEDGVIHILGRYKDIIIRGGENIYPAKVELALSKILDLRAHVVGVPDEVAGQIAVAVIEVPDPLGKTRILEKIRGVDMGYTVDEIFTLDEIGLSTLPLTSLGKVKKGLLREALTTHRAKIRLPGLDETQEPQHLEDPGSLLDTLVKIWERLTGACPPIDESLAYLGDSIMFLRYCDGVLRQCGQRLYLQDLADNDTLEKQAKLLFQRSKQDIPGEEEPLMNSIGVQSLPMLKASQRFGYRSSKSDLDISPQSRHGEDLWRVARLKMQDIGLVSAKIEALCPIRTSLHRAAVGQREQSYHNRMVFRVRGADIGQLRQGLKRALRSRPMMRSVLCQTAAGEPFHAIIRADSSLHALVREVHVQSRDEAEQLYQGDSPVSHNSPLMCRCELIEVSESKELYLSMTYNHSVVDALTLISWHFDLNQLVCDPDSELAPRTPYKMFSDLFSQYQDSVPAQASIAFHVKRLRGISRFRKALWPRQKAPGWMISNDSSSPQAQERDNVRRSVWNGEWEIRASEFRYPRLGRVVRLPWLKKLQQEHGIHPAVFTKSALIILNVLQTGSTHAVFNTWESGRSWPFVPPWMESMLPPAMSIDGPTAQWILCMFEVMRTETIAGFLKRQVEEHEQVKRHEHVPWQKLVDALGDEGDIAIDASYRQSFVWDVSIGLTASQGFRNDMAFLEPVARYDWPDCGLFWNAYMLDSDDLYFIASWDTAQMNADEVQGHCDVLADVMRKLADDRRWDDTVGEVFGV